MPIHFACQKCGKALFAQEQYAGQMVKCPGCQTENTIPSPAAPRGGVAGPPEPPPPHPPQPSSNALLIDMEKGPEPQAQPPTTGGTASSAVTNPSPYPLPQGEGENKGTGAGAGTAPVPQAAAGTAAPQADEPTKRCPMCAETIKAAARKCRFCGTILDEELRAEEAAQHEHHAMAGMLAQAERSTHIWRTIATVAATVTTGWLVLLTMGMWREASPMLIAFNLLLIVGLIWNTRQMRRGPANVFLAAACAVVLCMPLDLLLGLTVLDADAFNELQKQDPQHYANLTLENVNRVMGFLVTMVGFVISIPVWIAMLKVTYLQRLHRAMTPRNGLEGRR